MSMEVLRVLKKSQARLLLSLVFLASNIGKKVISSF